MVYETLKIRIFPSAEQEEYLIRLAGACRFMWNHLLAYRERYYSNYNIHLNKYSLSKYITFIMKTDEYGWLKNYSSHTLRKILERQDASYDRYFNGTGNRPKFKKKKGQFTSIPVRADRIKIYEEEIKLEKIGKLRYSFSYKNKDIKKICIKSASIKLVNNKWILFVVIIHENQVCINGDKIAGIDLGIKELATCSVDYEKIVFHNINKTKRIKNLISKEKHIQRVIDRKFRDNNYSIYTNNINKYIEKLRKIRNRMANIRKNYVHQCTSYLIKQGLCAVVMETLSISSMARNKNISRHLSGEYLQFFRYCMEYKCKWNNVYICFADKFFPSSKTCSCCGHIKKDLSLSDRVYVCNNCGNIIDRDFNAAINLMKYYNGPNK